MYNYSIRVSTEIFDFYYICLQSCVIILDLYVTLPYHHTYMCIGGGERGDYPPP